MLLKKEIESLLLGLVQGLTEFFPISSSGHLVLFQQFFNVEPISLLFVLVLHLGTLFAILCFYRSELMMIASGFVHSPFSMKGSNRSVYLVGVALLPSVLGVIILEPIIKESFNHLNWISLAFILTGFCLFSTRWALIKQHNFSCENPINAWQNFSYSSALFIGLSQMVALFPGMSRSGWTIATAILLGIPKKQALLFSFLLVIPTILGGTLWEICKQPHFSSINVIQMTLGFFSSWFFGYLALKFLYRSLQNTLFSLFAFYLWSLALFIIMKELL